jgi:hypothetical protein
MIVEDERLVCIDHKCEAEFVVRRKPALKKKEVTLRTWKRVEETVSFVSSLRFGNGQGIFRAFDEKI